MPSKSTKRPLKIAMIAPLVERVPPQKYGGTERVVSELTEELTRRGHEVTLFASGDSLTSARLVYVHSRPLREDKIKDLYGVNGFTALNIGLVYKHQKQFDIIHDHAHLMLSLPAANIATTPVVMTLHGPIEAGTDRIYEELDRPHFVSISNSQTAHHPRIKTAGTVYNGLSMEHYPFGPKPGAYLLFVGRICMEKGTHHAIAVAQALQMPLIIAAKLNEDIPADMEYYRAYVKPYLNEQIKWVGEVDDAEKTKLMSEALCMLHPVTWPEPFGLTLIEGMACGSPVVAFRMGSIPEIIVDGQTGYVVDDEEAMAEAVGKIHRINRRACRDHAINNFNAQRMADGYEQVYYRAVDLAQEKLLRRSGKTKGLKPTELASSLWLRGRDSNSRPID